MSSGQVTDELACGGALYADRARTLYASALASVLFPGRKSASTSPAGTRCRCREAWGPRSSAWSSSASPPPPCGSSWTTGAGALPAEQRGAREQAFGVGPEVAVLLPPLRTKVSARYVQDFGVRSRPEGRLLYFGLTIGAWLPR